MTPPPPETGLPAGTPVLTPTGEVAVEAILPGDLVIAVSGTAAPFQRVVAVRRVPCAGRLVRIRAGALADGAPREDLLVPPGLALLVDGVLVAAGALCDGAGLVEEAAPEGLDLVTLVLAAHDAVLSAGTAVETGLPVADAAPCLPRAEPDGPLRALLAWRAEAMGWAAPPPLADPAPVVGSLRDRLAASALTPAAPPPLPLPR